MKCLECEFDTDIVRSLSCHVRLHGMTIQEYKTKHGLHRRCNKCGNILSKNCSGNTCKNCYEWSGENNPFYGKTHSVDVIERMRKKNVEISREKWKNKEYREKVIRGVSKPRRKGFGKEQSVRVKEWYVNNPGQRDIRSNRMKRSWKEGKIEPSIHSCSESKKEEKIRSEISLALPNSKVEKKTIKIDGRWYRPDIIIDDWIIVEFFGDYWHGNSNRYKKEDIVSRGMKACEIWKRDILRIEELEKRYHVFIIWEKDYDEGKFDMDSLVENVMLAMDDG